MGGGHKIQGSDGGTKHEGGCDIGGLVGGDADVGVDVDVEEGGMTLLKFVNVAELFVSVASRPRRRGAPGKRVTGLHAAKAIGDHDGDRSSRRS